MFPEFLDCAKASTLRRLILDAKILCDVLDGKVFAHPLNEFLITIIELLDNSGRNRKLLFSRSHGARPRDARDWIDT